MTQPKATVEKQTRPWDSDADGQKTLGEKTAFVGLQIAPNPATLSRKGALVFDGLGNATVVSAGVEQIG